MIHELQRDGRVHITTLAHRLGIPRSTAQERLKRLQESGVIRGFVPVLDHAELGKPVLAHILGTFMPGTGVSQRDVARKLMKIPDVEEVHLISGEWDILMRVRGASLEAIGDLVLDRIREVEGIARTLTCASFHVEG